MKCIFTILCGVAMAFACTACAQHREIREHAKPQPTDLWDSNVPFANLIVRSKPRGAMVETLNGEGEWVTVGTTPIDPGLRMEASGRSYMIRLSKPGYFREVLDVAVMPGTRHAQVVEVDLRKDEISSAEDYWQLEHPKAPR